MKKLILNCVFSILLCIVISSGCNKNESTNHYPNASSNNIDDKVLFTAIEKARADKGILSIIVYRNNEVIVEEYFETNSSETVHPIRSVTKSITGILFGMAKDKGLIINLDATVGDYLADYLTAADSIVAEITIRNLLTMSGGFEWDELSDYDDFNNWVLSNDHFIYALNVPVINTPGTRFTYTTPGCQILSAIFTRATDYSLADFAKEFLYPQLEIMGERPWDKDQQGYSYGGIALNLTAKDMLKIGILIRDDGVYNGNQVLSKDWIVKSTTSYFETNHVMHNASHYGYLWWMGEKNNIDYSFANGYGGQFIFIYPELNLVVVAQSEINNDYRSPNEQWMNTISIITNDVFSSVN